MNSTTGLFGEHPWRTATGWFSYDLKNTDSKGWILRVTYVGEEMDRKFRIMANESEITAEKFTALPVEMFFRDYVIPAHLLKASGEKITIKFSADAGSTTPRIVEVRLLRGNIFRK